MNKFLSIISRLISILLQPLLMPLYGVCLLSYYTDFYDLYKNGIASFLFPVFLLSFLVPFLGLVVMRSIHAIKSFSLSTKHDRIYPIITYIMSSICLCYFFLQVQVPYWYIGLLLTGTIVALFAFILNFFWKISIHMMAIGALIGTSLAICLKIFSVGPYFLFIILFILSGILGVTRLYLKASSASQVYIGFSLGLLIGFITILMSVLFYY